MLSISGQVTFCKDKRSDLRSALKSIDDLSGLIRKLVLVDFLG